MEIITMNNNAQNTSNWFIIREDQSSMVPINLPVPAQQTGHFIIDSDGNRRFVHLCEPQDTIVTNRELLLEHKPHNVSQGKKDNFWDKNKIKLLLNLSSDSRYKNFNPCKDKWMWKEIAPILGTTPEKCCKKYLNLKVTFTRVYKKKLLGKNTKWVYYNLCEEAFREYKFVSPNMLDIWDENKVSTLLSLYIHNIETMQGRNGLKKDVWKEIAKHLGTTEGNCHQKFRSLKRSYLKIQERTRLTGKRIKWPYLHYFERIVTESNPPRWHKGKIKLLLEAYSQRLHKFSSPNYQKKELWKEIALVVNERAIECDRKFRNLKGTYMNLKNMEQSGKTITKWPYYDHFEAINNNTTIVFDDDITEQKYFMRKFKVENYIKELLLYYLEHKKEFRNPLIKNKLLWKTIGAKLNLSTGACDKKFRNLKMTYIRLAEQKRRTGKDNHWPYFSYFEKIYDNETLSSQRKSQSVSVEDVMLTEIQKVRQDNQERRESARNFEKLIEVVAEANNIQRERNRILQALLDRK